MLENISQIKEFSKKYNILSQDIILIALNLFGVNAVIPDDRIRFKLKLNTCDEIFYLAVCVNTGKSPFYLREKDLYLNECLMGTIIEKEKDTCDSTYFRRNKTALTLNSNSRSKCRGCKFCGTYSQEAADIHNLLTEDKLASHINDLLLENNLKDLSNIIDVGICTGCFNDEEDTLEHILMVRKVLKNFGFHKELKYLGSQILSERSLEILEKQAKPFSLYFTLECFTRRKELLRHHKAKITTSQARNVLLSAKKRGFNTTFLYILGLDPLESLVKEFRELLPCITRFPVINLFQNYLPEHTFLKILEANNLEYYFRARKELEKVFAPTDLMPRPWEDYRGLWYLSFGNKKIDDIRI